MLYSDCKVQIVKLHVGKRWWSLLGAESPTNTVCN